MKEINFHQLLIFYFVAKLGSFSSAAETLHISQPAVSTQVKLLERHYDQPLFTRRRRAIRLTKTGEIVFDYARRIFALSEEMEKVLQDLEGLASGRLVIGASTTIGEYCLPETMVRFKDRYPGVALELRISNTRQIADEVLRHELDIGFVGGKIDSPNLVVEAFAEDEIILIASPKHRLARKKNIRSEELREEAFITREKGSATRVAAEGRLKELGIEPKVKMELGSNESVKRAVLAGGGLGMLSRSSIEGKRTRLVVLTVPEVNCHRQLSLIYRQDKLFTSAEKAFLAMARSQNLSEATC